MTNTREEVMSQSNKQFKYKFTLGIGLCGCDREDVIDLADWTSYSAEELAQMSEYELDNAASVACKEWAQEYIENSWERVED